MIAVEALIKPLDYRKKVNWCFASSFTEAGSEISQTSKIELFEEIFNCFKSSTIFAETFILDFWLGSEHASALWQQNNTKFDLGKYRYNTHHKPISMSFIKPISKLF